jgi:hypothetical protein
MLPATIRVPESYSRITQEEFLNISPTVLGILVRYDLPVYVGEEFEDGTRRYTRGIPAERGLAFLEPPYFYRLDSSVENPTFYGPDMALYVLPKFADAILAGIPTPLPVSTSMTTRKNKRSRRFKK